MHLLCERPPALTRFSRVIRANAIAWWWREKKKEFTRGRAIRCAHSSATSINLDGNEWAYLKDTYQLALLPDWICLIKGTRCKRFYFHHCSCYLRICRPLGMNKRFPPYLSFFLSFFLVSQKPSNALKPPRPGAPVKCSMPLVWLMTEIFLE